MRLRAVFLCTTLATLVPWSGPAVRAASFPCAKAATPAEKAICATPALSGLDDALADAYGRVMRRLGGADPDPNAAQTAVRADQRTWLAERNACGADPDCLAGSYRRRITALTPAPDPAAPSPADRFIGTFRHGAIMEITAVGLRDGGVAVTVTGAEPTRARWICEFSGIGRPDRGRLVVGSPDAEGNGLVIEATDAGLDIPDTTANRAAGQHWCGFGGTFSLPYSRSTLLRSE